MAADAFISEFIRARRERGITAEQAAEIMGIDTDALRKYESGAVSASVSFMERAEKFMGGFKAESNLENIFTQGYFGSKIPLLTEHDFINDCENHVIYYMELPQLEHYGNDNLFALRYTGDNVPDMGILKNSVLVFVLCDKMKDEGVYAVVKRDKLKLEEMRYVDGQMRISELNGKKNRPRFAKSATARGKLVCCVNTYGNVRSSDMYIG